MLWSPPKPYRILVCLSWVRFWYRVWWTPLYWHNTLYVDLNAHSQGLAKCMHLYQRQCVLPCKANLYTFSMINHLIRFNSTVTWSLWCESGALSGPVSVKELQFRNSPLNSPRFWLSATNILTRLNSIVGTNPTEISKYNISHLRQCISKCRLPNVGHFVLTPVR